VNTYLADMTGVRDLAPFVIDEEGLPQIMPAAFYEQTTLKERYWLGHRYGLYLLPTVELCGWLGEHIGARSAIEIGAGNGRLADWLGIPATDSKLQEDPDMKDLYGSLGQAPVHYGPNVEKLEAKKAVRRYRPEVAIGAWVTHRYNPRRHLSGGNQFGPDMNWILERIYEYVLIGNEEVHAKNPLWDLPHEIHHLPFIYSRAVNGSRDFVAVWKGGRR
jgi:hypothetical protein